MHTLPPALLQSGLLSVLVLALFAARWRALEATGAQQPLDITQWKEFSSTQISERWLVEELAAAAQSLQGQSGRLSSSMGSFRVTA